MSKVLDGSYQAVRYLRTTATVNKKKELIFLVCSVIHDKVFDDIKELVSSPPLLKRHEPDKPLVLQCDAREKGLGASLLQGGKPLAYASGALTTTETNYVQIRKELLAIVFGVERHQSWL